jgi:hypothetical protein
VNLGVQMFLVSGIMLSAVYYIPLYFAFTRVSTASRDLYNLDEY